MTRAAFYLGVVIARAGSKRIPGKNLISLGGIPLIDYTLKAAAGACKLGAVAVSTDSEAIAVHVRAQGVAVPELRPVEIAGDSSPVVAAMQHALSVYERTGTRVDGLVLLQPTSPFRTSADIDQAIELFERTHADTVTAVRAARDHPHWAWRNAGDAIEPFFSRQEMTMDRKQLPLAFAENGAVYVARRNLIDAGRIYGTRVVPYLMDEASSVDIDTFLDLAWAEFLLARGVTDTRAESS
jgi:CMP-N-acetylneuraminic acid synthetase